MMGLPVPMDQAHFMQISGDLRQGGYMHCINENKQGLLFIHPFIISEKEMFLMGH